MKETKIARITLVATLSVAALLLLCGAAVAQTQVQGVIDGRKWRDHDRQVSRRQCGRPPHRQHGCTRSRRRTPYAEEADGPDRACPGLPVEVKGSYNAQNQLVADSVKFKGSELKNAQDIQAGVAPAEAQLQAQQQQLQQTEQQIQQQQAAMQAQQAQLTAEQQKMPPTKPRSRPRTNALASSVNTTSWAKLRFCLRTANHARPQYKPQLVQLAQKAKTIDAYVIQVKGYASSVGSAALNQKLSTERADNVTDFLEQQGRYPADQHSGSGSNGYQQTSRSRYNGGRPGRQSTRSG